jgi:endonuclease YncB( thermonuclease family)
LVAIAGGSHVRFCLVVRRHEVARQFFLSFVAVALAAPTFAFGQCVDINADPLNELLAIVHINEERAGHIVDGRPWPSVASLTGVHGIGRGRIRDIIDEGVACTGVRAARGKRETISGIATVLDGDTLEVAGERVRLIGIDAPEGSQMCKADGLDWPCGQIATAAVYEIVGTDSVECEVYGRDRWRRALAECFQHGESINAAIVRQGWALAWYPGTAAVLGPSFEEHEEAAAAVRVGIWRGTFTEPWIWRRH